MERARLEMDQQHWLSSENVQMGDSAFPLGLDSVKLSVMSKASLLSSNVVDITIGPNSHYDYSKVSFFSVPEQRNHGAGDCSLDVFKSLEDIRLPIEEELNESTVSSSGKQSVHLNGRSTTGSGDLVQPCVEKLLLEMEMERQQQVKEVMRLRTLEMEEKMMLYRLDNWRLKEEYRREREAAFLKTEEVLLSQLKEEERKATQRQLQLAEEHKQHAKLVNEKIRAAEEEARHKIKQTKLLLDKIHKSQTDFRAHYQTILDLARSCKDKQALAGSVSQQVTKLKTLYEAMDHLLKQCKVGEVSNLDVQTAAALCNQIEGIKNYIQEEVEKINDRQKQLEEQSAKETVPDGGAPVPSRQLATIEEEKSAPEQPPELRRPKSEVTETDSVLEVDEALIKGLADYIDTESYKMYISFQKIMKEYEKSYEALVKDVRFKKFRFDCQKAVNTPVNAISPVSASHLQDKFIRLARLLSGQVTEVSDGKVSAGSHPQGVAFCKDLLAKKLVRQGEHTVSSKPESAFAIAAVIVALWVEYPDFGELILAHFHRECPYLVPFFIPQVEGQSNEDYYRALGYNYSEDGQVEKQDKFLKRMSGIMRLYAAILISSPRKQQSKPHPHGIVQGWRWLTAILNLEPRPDICASLLFDFLEVTGSSLSEYYGRQFQKILHILCKEYFPKVKQVTPAGSGGPVARLENFLSKALRQGFIPPPTGLLSPNFW